MSEHQAMSGERKGLPEPSRNIFGNSIAAKMLKVENKEVRMNAFSWHQMKSDKTTRIKSETPKALKT